MTPLILVSFTLIYSAACALELSSHIYVVHVLREALVFSGIPGRVGGGGGGGGGRSPGDRRFLLPPQSHSLGVLLPSFYSY